MCTVCISLEQVDVILGMNLLDLNQMFTSCFNKLVQCAADCKSSNNVDVLLFLTLKMQGIRESCMPVKLGCL